LHPFPDAGSACLWIKPRQLSWHPIETKIENMKDWSASEEAFSNSIDSTWLSLFGGQKAVITNHPI
jgi:hypothetical protein